MGATWKRLFIAKPYLRVIKFSKLSISLKHDQFNKKEKTSVILTELKTECGEICVFPLENWVPLFPQFKPILCQTLADASDLYQYFISTTSFPVSLLRCSVLCKAVAYSP